MKINGYGDTLWLKRFHPPNSTASFGSNCCTSDNGSSVITGSTGGLNTAFLTKLDVNGNIIWEHEYSAYGITYHAHQVHKTLDGGYIVNGLDFIMKTDSLGNHIWHRHRLDYGFSNFICLTIGPTGEYLILYEIVNPPLYERGVAKFDDNGNLKWQKEITNWQGEAAEIIKRLSNGYLLMGLFGDPSNIITFKMNEEGEFSSYNVIPLEKREIFEGATNVINDNKYVFVTGTHHKQIHSTVLID